MEEAAESNASLASNGGSHAVGDSPPQEGGDGTKKRPRRKPEHPSRSADADGEDGTAARKRARGAGGVLKLPAASNPALASLMAAREDARRASTTTPPPGVPAETGSIEAPPLAVVRGGDVMARGMQATPADAMRFGPSLLTPIAPVATQSSQRTPPRAAVPAVAPTTAAAASAVVSATAASGKMAGSGKPDIRGYFSAAATGPRAPAAAPIPLPTSVVDTTASSDAAIFSSRNNTSAPLVAPPPTPATAAPLATAAPPAPDVAKLRAQLADAQRALVAMQSVASAATGEVSALVARLKHSEGEAERMKDAATRAASEVASSKKTSMANLRRLLLEHAFKDDITARRSLSERQLRLGHIVMTKSGSVTKPDITEMWEDGEEFIQLRVAEDGIKVRQAELTRIQKELTKRNRKLRGAAGDKPAPKGRKSAAAAAAAAAAAQAEDRDGSDEDDDDGTGAGAVGDTASVDLFGGVDVAAAFGLTRGLSDALAAVAAASSGVSSGAAGGMAVLAQLDIAETEESVKVALSNLKKEKAALEEKRKALEAEKALLILDIKKQRAAVNSAFRGHPVLGDRFMLMELLGKGGFSEVWRGVDLHNASDVAVKVHQLNPHWPEEKRRNYVRHAVREYEIQRELVHPNVVPLAAVIEIDDNSFATAMEYCRGGDLEKLLKSVGSLLERDARSIIMQVLSSLRYLNGYTSAWSAGADVEAAAGGMPPPKRKIIHYDLKPANILFDEFRNAKVTDFGLSKIVDDDGSEGATSMELTSQGAGTYWYLPPECFQHGGARISSKVDVWSVGIIFYQMLYGRRPFGEGQSQEAMVASGTLLQQAMAGPIFPAKPTVSAEAKAFIKRCLTPQQTARPDVLTLCEDAYLRMKMRGQT